MSFSVSPNPTGSVRFSQTKPGTTTPSFASLPKQGLAQADSVHFSGALTEQNLSELVPVLETWMKATHTKGDIVPPRHEHETARRFTLEWEDSEKGKQTRAAIAIKEDDEYGDTNRYRVRIYSGAEAKGDYKEIELSNLRSRTKFISYEELKDGTRSKPVAYPSYNASDAFRKTMDWVVNASDSLENRGFFQKPGKVIEA